MDKNKNFITYDYTQITIKKEMESAYIDTYENFGWELTDSESSTKPSGISSNPTLYFRRDRKINKKSDLNKLQRKVDVCFSNIQKLKTQKTSLASIKALSIGFLAIIFLALSVFIITDYIKISVIFSILFGSVGILLCIPPYFVYKSTVIKKTEELEPLIDKEYDNISDLCEEAHTLMNQDE